MFGVKKKFLFHRISFNTKLFLLGTFLCLFAVGLSFDWGMVIRHGDSTFPQDPELSLYKMLYSWDDMRRMGIDNSRGIADIFPYKFSVYFLSLLGIPLFINQIILFSLSFVLPFWGMFYFIHVVFPKRYLKLHAFFAGLLYTFNIYVLIKFSIPVFVIQMAYGFLPLLAGLGIQYLRFGKLRHIIFFLLCCLGNASIGNNIAFHMPLIFVLCVMFFGMLWKTNAQRWEICKRAVYLGLAFVVINLWWLIPQFATVSQQLQVISDSTFVKEYNERALRSVSFSGIILNSLRFIGTWTWFHNDRYGTAFFEEQQMYDGIYAFWGFSFVALAFMALLIKRNSRLLYMAFVFAVGVFFMKGISQPYGEIFLWMFENVPLFWIFRFTYDKFGPLTVLGQAALVGYTLNYICLKFFTWRPKKFYMVLSFSTLYIVMYMFPFWQGNLFRDGYPVKTQIQFPDAYFQAAEYLNNDEGDYRVAILPFSLGKGIARPFSWDYIGMDPFEFLTYKSVVYHLLEIDAPGSDIVRITKQFLYDGKFEEYAKLSSLFNFEKIIVENTAAIELFPSYDFPEKLKDYAEENPEIISHEKSFGNDIDIYNLEKNTIQSKFYIPDQIHYFDGKYEDLDNLSYFLNEQKQDAFVHKKYNDNTNIKNIVNNSLVVLPKFHEVQLEENLEIPLLAEGEYELWHKSDEYFQYKLFFETSPAALKVVRSPQTIQINNAEFQSEELVSYKPFALNIRKYDYLVFEIDGRIIQEVDLQNYNKKGIYIGTYAFQKNKRAHLRIYGVPKYYTDNSVKNASFENSTWKISERLSLSDPSFEEGIWHFVQDAQRGKGGNPEIDAKLVDDSSDGGKSLQISAKGHNATMHQRIYNFDPGSLYQITFDYKIVEGDTPFINLVEQGVKKYHTFDLPAEDDSWHRFTKTFQPEKASIGLSLYLYANAPEDISKKSVVQYDNIRIQKVSLIEERSDYFAPTKENNIHNVGKIVFDDKKAHIAYGSKSAANNSAFLKDPSFEIGTWSKVGNSKANNPGIPTMLAQRVEDSTDGKYSLLLSTNKHMANVRQKLTNFDPFSKYLVRLSSKREQGVRPHYLIHQKGINLYEPKGEIPLINDGEWFEHSFVFQPHSLATSAILYLFAGDGKETQTDILYDNVRIDVINSLDTFILRQIDSQKSAEKNTNRVNIVKHSPVHYTGNISSNKAKYVLVFGEAFHPSWKITLQNLETGNRVEEKIQHFVVNGYANGWVIPKGAYEVTIEYTNQKYFWIGLYAAFIGVLSFSLLLILDKKYLTKNKK